MQIFFRPYNLICGQSIGSRKNARPAVFLRTGGKDLKSLVVQFLPTDPSGLPPDQRI